ncbi:unnamed protein product [Vitrella brassicaformis CCMP3155]|uniref:Uncharacterized protein n=1 Tax=Vitrella brassicaformis (strain CCMP3155) TaxID=1169540 RepID=A0A0G4ES37_VITBC|nr:unnamed protein product [Vitrella brassicaformis CCMP3155]|eukprot:CEM00717.1 unnamed protein product [Vitrella brassicaformis CCMP3155]
MALPAVPQDDLSHRMLEVYAAAGLSLLPAGSPEAHLKALLTQRGALPDKQDGHEAKKRLSIADQASPRPKAEEHTKAAPTKARVALPPLRNGEKRHEHEDESRPDEESAPIVPRKRRFPRQPREVVQLKAMGYSELIDLYRQKKASDMISLLKQHPVKTNIRQRMELAEALGLKDSEWDKVQDSSALQIFMRAEKKLRTVQVVAAVRIQAACRAWKVRREIKRAQLLQETKSCIIQRKWRRWARYQRGVVRLIRLRERRLAAVITIQAACRGWIFRSGRAGLTSLIKIRMLLQTFHWIKKTRESLAAFRIQRNWRIYADAKKAPVDAGKTILILGSLYQRSLQEARRRALNVILEGTPRPLRSNFEFTFSIFALAQAQGKRIAVLERRAFTTATGCLTKLGSKLSDEHGSSASNKADGDSSGQRPKFDGSMWSKATLVVMGLTSVKPNVSAKTKKECVAFEQEVLRPLFPRRKPVKRLRTEATEKKPPTPGRSPAREARGRGTRRASQHEAAKQQESAKSAGPSKTQDSTAKGDGTPPSDKKGGLRLPAAVKHTHEGPRQLPAIASLKRQSVPTGPVGFVMADMSPTSADQEVARRRRHSTFADGLHHATPHLPSLTPTVLSPSSGASDIRWRQRSVTYSPQTRARRASIGATVPKELLVRSVQEKTPLQGLLSDGSFKYSNRLRQRHYASLVAMLVARRAATITDSAASSPAAKLKHFDRTFSRNSLEAHPLFELEHKGNTTLEGVLAKLGDTGAQERAENIPLRRSTSQKIEERFIERQCLLSVSHCVIEPSIDQPITPVSAVAGEWAMTASRTAATNTHLGSDIVYAVGEVVP